MMGMPYIRQFMEESSRTVNGFEMRNIVLLDPDRINQSLDTILKAEKEDIFRMCVTDGETKGRLTNQPIERYILAIFPFRND